MVADFWAEPQFLILAVVCVAFVLPFLLLVLELTEVHDPANRRFFLRRNFHKVHADFAGAGQGFSGFDDTEQGAVMSDDADRRDADLFVDPLAFLSESYGTIS
jgi:hypothetical protein